MCRCRVLKKSVLNQKTARPVTYDSSFQNLERTVTQLREAHIMH